MLSSAIRRRATARAGRRSPQATCTAPSPALTGSTDRPPRPWRRGRAARRRCSMPGLPSPPAAKPDAPRPPFSVLRCRRHPRGMVVRLLPGMVSAEIGTFVRGGAARRGPWPAGLVPPAPCPCATDRRDGFHAGRSAAGRYRTPAAVGRTSGHARPASPWPRAKPRTTPGGRRRADRSARRRERCC